MMQEKTKKILEEELGEYCARLRKRIDDRIDIIILKTILGVVEKNKKFNEGYCKRNSNGQFSRYLGGKDETGNEEYEDARVEIYNQKMLEDEVKLREEKLNGKGKSSVRACISDDYRAINEDLEALKTAVSLGTMLIIRK